MSAAQHTPGPWQVDADESDGSFFVFVPPVVDMGTGMTIAKRGPNEKRAAESLANARLIASSPEMLAVLERIRDDQTWRTADNKLWPDLCAVINKATGAAA